MEEIRMMHLKLLLQDGPKYSASDAIINQCTWNDDITNQPNVMFKSFFTSIVGGDFDRRQKTFQDILNKCDDWESHNWKNVLLLLRMAVNAIDSTHFNIDECNTFKAMAKSKLTTFSYFITSLGNCVRLVFNSIFKGHNAKFNR